MYIEVLLAQWSCNTNVHRISRTEHSNNSASWGAPILRTHLDSVNTLNPDVFGVDRSNDRE